MMSESLRPLLEAREYDPFRLLGLHRTVDGWLLRVFRPHASSIAIDLAEGQISLQRVKGTDIFEWRGPLPPHQPYLLHITEGKQSYACYDPYAFPPHGSEHDVFLFGAGKNSQAYNLLGAHPETRRGIAGVAFRTWAPNAERVSVIGDFNRWDGRTHQMGSLGGSGVWEIFIPGLTAGDLYKFEIRQRTGGHVRQKCDPYARAFEHRPSTAARVCAPSAHAWQDSEWMAARAARDWLHAPMSVYEVHAGSWMRHVDGSFYSYRELAERLVPYVKEMAYTHIEFLPLMEHPLDESWGYQCTGFFAASSRFGTPDDLRFLIDTCHQAGIGVLLDWVPGHFPADDWALANYDGTALYEHADPRQGKHPDWGTLVFNYERNEVRSFLLSSANWWLNEFHADGLRVDAVASMLYLDYSRKKGEWLPNRFGGRENLEAISFLRELNEMVHRDFPGALTVAEESTAWPQVSRPVYVGGLGFSMKWNMGWMNDTLGYFERDAIHRRYHHDRLTFGQLYAYSENFTLPLSHDEVVHGKGSLLGKMPGDEWQRFANLRSLISYHMTMPGKKLTFMGNEIAQSHEWREREELPWHLLQWAPHKGVQRLAADLNRMYRDIPALYELDFSASGFAWIDCHDNEQSVISWLRYAHDGSFVVVIANFTPVPRYAYRIGVPHPGEYRELFNSDSEHYAGSNMGNANALQADASAWMHQPASLQLTLPPLAVLILEKTKG